MVTQLDGLTEVNGKMVAFGYLPGWFFTWKDEIAEINEYKEIQEILDTLEPEDKCDDPLPEQEARKELGHFLQAMVDFRIERERVLGW